MNLIGISVPLFVLSRAILLFSAAGCIWAAFTWTPISWSNVLFGFMGSAVLTYVAIDIRKLCKICREDCDEHRQV